MAMAPIVFVPAQMVLAIPASSGMLFRNPRLLGLICITRFCPLRPRGASDSHHLGGVGLLILGCGGVTAPAHHRPASAGPCLADCPSCGDGPIELEVQTLFSSSGYPPLGHPTHTIAIHVVLRLESIVPSVPNLLVPTGIICL